MTSTTSPSLTPAYRPDIDGLRAIAVLGVIIFHAFPRALPGGFTGVDVFFVISGYLITALLLQDFNRNTFSILNFYARRIRRIFPALLTMLVVVWLLGYALLMPGEFRELGKSMVHSAYFANNFLLVAQAGYFDTDAELKPLQHLWSLAVEEQFYIVWPWLLLLSWRLHSKGKWFTALLTLTSLAWAVFATSRHPIAAFFLPHYRAWELLAGALIALNATRLRQHFAQAAYAAWIGWLGLVIVLFAYVWIDGSMPYPGWRAIFPVLGTALIILSPTHSSCNRWLFATRPAVAIGLISYPLYLWHWPLLSYGRILFGEPSTLCLLTLLLLSFLLAWATYRFLELPIRHAALPLLQSKWLPITGLLVLIGLGGTGDFTNFKHGFPERVVGKSWQEMQWADEHILDSNCRSSAIGVQGEYCQRHQATAITHVLLGDSHANHFFPGLAGALAKHGGNLLQIQGPVKISDNNWKNATLIENTPDIKTVFIAYHYGRMKQTDNPFGPTLESLILRLQRAGKHVALIVDNPEFDFDPRLCTPRPALAKWIGAGDNAAQVCNESMDYMRRKRTAYTDYLASLAAKIPGLHLIDTFAPFCSASHCAALQGERPLFRDRHHLTTLGSEIAFSHSQLNFD